jgi:hypothetical protein
MCTQGTKKPKRKTKKKRRIINGLNIQKLFEKGLVRHWF